MKGVFSKSGGIVLALLILSLLVYGGLLFYGKKLKTELNDIKQEIADLESRRDKEAEETIIETDKRLNLVEGLFKEHFYWTKLLSKIEELTSPQIYFTESKFNFLNEKVELTFSGNAKTYTALAQQMVSFKEDPLVEKVVVAQISLSQAGGIEFDLSVTFSKSILLISSVEENQ